MAELAEKKFVKVVRSIPAIIIVAVVLFFGLKGCIVTTWSPPKQPTTYAVVGEDDRKMTFTFLPDRRALIIYEDPNKSVFEAVLCRMRWGEYATHYFGPLWNVSQGAESFAGIRWVSNGAKPVRMSYEVLNKFHQGSGDSSFSPIGSEHETVFYFRDDEFKFSDMWLKKVLSDPTVIDPIIKKLETK